MRIRYHKDGSYIELDEDLIEPLSGENHTLDLFQDFIKQGKEKGLFAKTCDEKYCDRHYRIIIDTR